MAQPVVQKPSVGRIVHFMSPDSEHLNYAGHPIAAVITSVLNDEVVCLTTFPPGSDPIPHMHVTFSESEHAGMRWFWPPRV